MSLINRTLRNLEARQGGEQRSRFAGLAAEGPVMETVGRRSGALRIAILLAVLLAAAGAVSWLHDEEGAEQVAVSPPEPPATRIEAVRAAEPVRSAPVEPPGSESLSAPTPFLRALAPSSLDAGSGVQRVSLRGSGFLVTSRVMVEHGGTRRDLPPASVRFVSPHRLDVRIGTAVAGPLLLQVNNPDAGASRALPLTIREAEAEAVGNSQEPEAVAVVPITKKRRPLTAAQRAEQAYREAYRLLQQGRRGEAELALREALEAEPSHLAARETLAGLFVSTGRSVEALAVVEQGLAQHPGSAKFALLGARLRLGQGDRTGALALMEEGMQSGGNDADYLAFAALLYRKEGRYAESMMAYQRALALAPRRAEWWLGLGIAIEGDGDSVRAREAYEKALASPVLAERLKAYARDRIEALKAANR